MTSDEKSLSSRHLHPDAALAELLEASGVGKRKREKLRRMHDLCSSRFDRGERVYWQAQVVRELEAAGVMKYADFVSPTAPEYRLLCIAWQNYCDQIDLNLDGSAPEGHPDVVVRHLLADPKRRKSAETLRVMHKFCRARFEKGDSDFTATTVAKEIAAAGLMSSSVIRRQMGTGYRNLLDAWQSLADSRDARISDQIPAEDTDAVFERLLKGRGVTQVAQGHLRRINEVCKERFALGEYDFGTRAISVALVEANVFSGKASGLADGLRSNQRYWRLLQAWQARADAEWMPKAHDLEPTNPHSVYRRLRGKTNRGDKLRRLLRVHRVCYLEHASGRHDFSVRSIGKVLADKGVIAVHSLHKSAYEDMRTLTQAWDEYARPWLGDAGVVPPKTVARRQKSHDPTLEWVRREYPLLEEWRLLAVEWLQSVPNGLGQRIATMSAFFGNYLTLEDVPNSPAEFFLRGKRLPGFEKLVPKSSSTRKDSIKSYLQEFFEWILLREFSAESDDGVLVISPAFQNPLTRTMSRRGKSRPSQSVRAPLPYGYVHDLRHALAEGTTFREWKFAQRALGADGKKGAPGRDWYEVDRSVIDENDPDCVWRIRKFATGRVVYQMWSPVRWVAVLMKLLLPVRTTQVRLLDSGESDTWQYKAGDWVANDGPLAPADADKAWRQGVLRRNEELEFGEIASTVLYINTNKTTDIDKAGEAKGYVIPWFIAPEVIENVYFWLEKLRDWQRKYNPIKRRISWAELDGRHITVKSSEQRASYPDTCFLFRMPEAEADERGFPVSDAVVSLAWANLLEEFQNKLALAGQVHPGGTPIVFVRRDKAGRFISNDFPLHSLRVSLITALALDGGVPFAILQKVVGHSRLLMTLYYTKAGPTRTAKILSEAAQKMEDGREASIIRHLQDSEHERLVDTAVFNNRSVAKTIIPIHPADRNPAGWMPMHHGLCLVGGNVSEGEGNQKLGGCYNGGSLVDGRSAYGPVPGGSRNCVRCRWFVTEPHFLPALAAHFNVSAYHFDEARNRSIRAERELQEIRREKASKEFANELFDGHKKLNQAERIMESSLKSFSDWAENLVATWRLIERCRNLVNQLPSEGLQLIIQGSVSEVEAIFEETESELLQLCGVCESVELYPDLDADKAVLRRSQLLDSALYNDGLPPIFLSLSPAEQLKAGNAFIRRLSQCASTDSPTIGQRKVVAIIDAGEKIGESLGIDLSTMIPSLAHPIRHRAGVNTVASA